MVWKSRRELETDIVALRGRIIVAEERRDKAMAERAALQARIDKALAVIRAERQPNPGSPWEVMDEFMRYFERKLQAILKGDNDE